MYLVVGLGNIGGEYSHNRHNIGFLFLDYIIKNNNLNGFKKKKNFYYSLNFYSNEEVAFIKPTTFMNLSGNAVLSAMTFFKVNRENLLIIYDDAALSFGKIRIREKGSDGGHNGLKNIRQILGTEEYKRIRIGINAPSHHGQLISHVLSDFTDEEFNKLENEVFKTTEEPLKLIIKNNIKEAMNLYNGQTDNKSKI